MKKLLCIVCALALAALSGCALAKADSVDPGAEILVGAFVTAESLSKPWNNTAIELTRTEKGWEFPNVEGIWVYQIPVYENSRLSFEISEDPRADLGGITARVGGGVSWSATLTLANTIDPDTALHFNPLYLRQDGTMYTVADIGLGVDPELVGQGGAWTSHHESAAPVYDWSQENWSTSVDIHYEIAIPAETYVLCRMDEQNRELSRQTYLPGELPEELELQCSWLLLEKQLADGRVERQAFGTEDGQLVTLVAGEDGFCRRDITALVWKP